MVEMAKTFGPAVSSPNNQQEINQCYNEITMNDFKTYVSKVLGAFYLAKFWVPFILYVPASASLCALCRSPIVICNHV
jgi:hypothetical protein